MRKTIAQHMYDILLENKLTTVWYGDLFLIEECAKRANINATHPKKKIRKVLNALDRSTLFSKKYIQADFSGKNRIYRSYSLAK